MILAWCRCFLRRAPIGRTPLKSLLRHDRSDLAARALRRPVASEPSLAAGRVPLREPRRIHDGSAAARGEDQASGEPSLILDSPTCARPERSRAEVRAPLGTAVFLPRSVVPHARPCTQVTGDMPREHPNSLPEGASIPQTRRLVKRLGGKRHTSCEFTRLFAGNSPREYSRLIIQRHRRRNCGTRLWYANPLRSLHVRFPAR